LVLTLYTVWESVKWKE